MRDEILKIREEAKKIHNLKNTEKKWIFYYDETDNCRKVILTERGFNDNSDSKIFVLGGVMGENENSLNTFNMDFLKRKLQLHPKLNEIKFKDIFKEKKEFLTLFNSRKLETILKIFLESDLYIHFYAIDLLYFSTVDIVDTLDSAFNKSFVENQKIKNELYNIIKKNQKEFDEKAYELNYPNIEVEKLSFFYDFIKTLIRKEKKDYLLKFFESDISDVPFIANNPQLKNKKNPRNIDMIEHFGEFYTSNLSTFKNSIHFLDKEKFIEDILDEMYKILEFRPEDINYKFIDSKESIFIQLSDILVGIIKIYLKYIRDYDLNPYYLQAQQEKNLKLLSKIIIKSDRLSNALIHNSLPLEVVLKFNNIIGHYR